MKNQSVSPKTVQFLSTFNFKEFKINLSKLWLVITISETLWYIFALSMEQLNWGSEINKLMDLRFSPHFQYLYFYTN